MSTTIQDLEAQIAALQLKCDRYETRIEEMQQSAASANGEAPIGADGDVAPVWPTDLSSSQPASDYTATKGTPFHGLGFNSLVCPYDPTLMETDRSCYPSTMLIPDEALLQSEDVTKVSSHLFGTIMCNVDLRYVSETTLDGSGRSVQNSHIGRLQAIFNSSFVSNASLRRTMKSLGCEVGFASPNSVCDGYFVDKSGMPRGILEGKSNAQSPSDGARQAVAEATNVAFHQFLQGVPVADILVPVVSTTGVLIQFFAVVLLDVAFPMVVNLSRVLDLTSPSDRRIAAGFVIKLTQFMERGMVVRPASGSQSYHTILSQSCGLSKHKYYVKEAVAFYCSRENFDDSVLYFLHVLGVLWEDEQACRKLVVFPYCFRQDGSSFGIVFPLLVGFRIGLPEDREMREAFVSCLEAAMAALHRVGVVHMDWYLSNFMWMRDASSGELIVKVIDLDSALVASDGLSEISSSRLLPRRNALAALEEGGVADLRNYDISLMRVLRANIDDERLRSTDKAQLDVQFISLQTDYLERALLSSSSSSPSPSLPLLETGAVADG